ncbi:methyl-accepting chemotaxis protein [Rhizobium sp. SG570]|uniref:methyl-accepting chemotaxis protein n=1 Tax=Rhizobium sp. SG570 TaxID=2587113 RepID=UPI001445BFB5|nr:methyl-accepting chemotaxis protein [Rhizobium sp. SG570]NKJ34502.1 methyl-accepting chemotaxis protein [Rhizobium sp. SG570]
MAGTEARYVIRDYGPMLLFASVTIGGMIFIWSSKLMGWSLPIVTGVPLLLMGIYFVVSLAFAGFRLHNEQAGDNLYYMGFLFTLSSLGVSLYLFAGETSIETIVRNFGIAVTSTIAGVTLRILFNQMRRDPIDIERSVRHELAEMTRRVRTELDSSSREFSHYRRVSNQMLSEGFEEIAHQAERNGQEISKILEVLAKQAVTPINDAAAQLTATTSQLSDIIGKFGTTVESVGKKLEEIRSPEDVVRAELAPAIVAIKDMSEAQLQPLRNIEEALNRMAEAMGQTPLPRLKADDGGTVSKDETVPRKRWWRLW